MSKINDKYIRARFGEELPQKNVDNLRTAMQKYGENHWWEFENNLLIAVYQVFENICLVDFSKFHEGLERLLGRPVLTHELRLNIEGIREETRLSIKRLARGIGASYEQRETAFTRSIEMLEAYCRETGKKFLKMDLSKKPNDRNKDGIDTSGYDGWLNPQ